MDPLEARSLIPLTGHYIDMNHARVSPMSRAQPCGNRAGHFYNTEEEIDRVLDVLAAESVAR